MSAATQTATTSGVRKRPVERASAPASMGGAVDGWLCLTVVFLLSLGVVLVYSSSAAHAVKVHGDAEYFLRLQLIRAAVGGLFLFGLYKVPGEWLRKNASFIFLGGVILLIAVLIPGVGVIRGGARRWIMMGPVFFQPSEFVKLAVVVGLAAILARRESRPADKRSSLLAPVLVAQIPVALVICEPDLGTAMVIELLTGVLVFVAGVRVRTLVLLILAALPVFYHQIISNAYALKRVLGFLDPWTYRQTVGYQLSEALISTGSGGISGLGLGEGKHGLFFLPEAHTDFIFAILGQELGLLGVLTLLGAFAVLLWRATFVALRATNAFDHYVAIGVVALIGVPAVFNTCVVTGLLPTKGLPLPLVSYGGSNLIATLAALGLLLRVDRDGRAGRGG